MNRKGSIYFLTLSSAVLLMTMVLGLSVMIMKQRRVARVDAHVDEATICAELGILHALSFVQQTPTWRDMLPNGEWLTDIPNGPSIYTVSGIDPIDGVLNVGVDEPVVLTSTATVAAVTRSLEVQIRDSKEPYDCLSYAIAAQGNITLIDYSQVNGNLFSGGNINVTGTLANVNGSAAAVGSIVGAAYISGTVTPNSPTITFPDSTAVLAHFVSLATPIPHSTNMRKETFGPNYSSLGPANANGIYVIDCGGKSIRLGNSRVLGTLILLNARDASIDDSSLRSASPDMPVLIIQGSSIIDFKGSSGGILSEASDLQDFSLPIEPGFGTITDQYPEIIDGLAYIVGDLEIGERVHPDGALVVTGTVTFDVTDTGGGPTYNTTVYDNPAYGFYESGVEVVPGSWQQVILP
jgi:hypothetical protein